MKLTNVSAVQIDANGGFKVYVALGKGPAARALALDLEIEPEQYEEQKNNPVSINSKLNGCYLFHDRVVRVEEVWGVSEEELTVRIKHFVLKQEKDFDKVVKDVEAFEKMTEAEDARRERLPDSVKLFVWQRDQGKCVRCGSNEKLEFDHIIPFAMGGSNTERNLQLLCESCNRSKGKSIVA